MADSKYQEPRPSIPADIQRTVEVQSGHACAVNRCGEHTYLEVHHINGNREDNRIANLILLCDKHHKMAEAGVIDRKSLREYNEQLKQTYNKLLVGFVTRLEQLEARMPKQEIEPEVFAEADKDADLPVKMVASRPSVMARTLEQLALAKFEQERGLYLEREIRFTKGDARLALDAVRQDDSLPQDLVVEVRWLRKRYLDGSVWLEQIETAVSLYELITARKARGILVLIVPNSSMKQLSDLPFTSAALEASVGKPEVVIYTYEDLGFDPGPISAGVFASNIKPSQKS